MSENKSETIPAEQTIEELPETIEELPETTEELPETTEELPETIEELTETTEELPETTEELTETTEELPETTEELTETTEELPEKIEELPEASIAKELKPNLELFPDILKTVPLNMLVVKFENKQVDNGNVLTPTEVKDKPTLQWNVTENILYFVVMVDPDAPTKKNPKLSLYQHWLVGNVPGTEINRGTILTDYLSAAPPKNSGPHRFVFLIYEQPKEIVFTEKVISKKTGKGREKFDIHLMVEKYGLGEPIAGNFFIAEWDSYVTTVENQLGVKV